MITLPAHVTRVICIYCSWAKIHVIPLGPASFFLSESPPGHLVSLLGHAMPEA
jgi:hypothetical protein